MLTGANVNKRLVKTINTTLEEQLRRSVFHVAGHAYAICCINKERYLPPVYFQVKLNKVLDETKFSNLIFQKDYRDQFATLEGGLLINTLPQSLESLFNEKISVIDNIESKIQEAIFVFETDIINLFTGPLTELKYVSSIEDKSFNQSCLNIYELEHYGGGSKLLLIKQYMLCITNNERESEGKLAELFSFAFNFVDENKNWLAINGLANYLMESDKKCFSYEEITSFLSL